MPELPEVETIRRDLSNNIVGQCIVAVDIRDARVLRQSQVDFVRRLENKKILAVNRRGKALIVALSGQEFLVVQVMMTGQLIVNGAVDTHTRIAFKLSADNMLYNDQRVFGQLRVVNDLSTIKHFNILGPEPFEDGFNRAYIEMFLKKTARPIKSVLLDHEFVAGVGNIYASEILFQSRISPTRLANTIKRAEVTILIKKTRSVLQQAIDLRGTSMRNYRDGLGEKGTFNKVIHVYARDKQPCHVCQRHIVRLVQSGRSTFYCRNCQK